MSRQPTKAWLAAGVWVLLTAPLAVAQGVSDAQLFAPAEVSEYGGGRRPFYGWFFTAEYLHWNISAPDVTAVGFPDLTRTVYYAPDVFEVQSNSLDTGFIEAGWSDGNRIEVGFVQGHHGWLFSSQYLGSLVSRAAASSVDIVFSDPPYGPSPPRQLLQGYVDAAQTIVRDLPVTFDDMILVNRVQTWGLELNYLYRFHPTHHGCQWEIFLGCRYMEFNDRFEVDAYGGTLADSTWNTRANNHIVGPQIGTRLALVRKRWTIDLQGRFFAGFNSQNIDQRGTLGEQLAPPGGQGQPLSMGPSSFHTVDREREWAPAAELRLALKYQLTRQVACTVGWTGYWQDGIARASNLIYYEVPHMGITMAHNRQDIFINGVSVGIEVNR